MRSKIVKVKNVSIPTIGYAKTMINKPQNTVFVGINNFGKINPVSPINIALSDYDGTVYILVCLVQTLIGLKSYVCFVIDCGFNWFVFFQVFDERIWECGNRNC